MPHAAGMAPGDVEGALSRHYACRVREFVEARRRVLVLENEVIRLELLPDKGSEIVSLVHKPTDTDVMWHRSMSGGPAPALLAGAGQSDAAAFLDTYDGGWQECPATGVGVRT